MTSIAQYRAMAHFDARFNQIANLVPELLHPSWGSSTYSALKRMGKKFKTDTVPNDETSEIERDLCAFGGGSAPAPF